MCPSSDRGKETWLLLGNTATICDTCFWPCFLLVRHTEKAQPATVTEDGNARDRVFAFPDFRFLLIKKQSKPHACSITMQKWRWNLNPKLVIVPAYGQIDSVQHYGIQIQYSILAACAGLKRHIFCSRIKLERTEQVPLSCFACQENNSGGEVS